jgi:hypothetical protein
LIPCVEVQRFESVREENDEAVNVAMNKDPNVEEKTPEIILRIRVHKSLE